MNFKKVTLIFLSLFLLVSLIFTGCEEKEEKEEKEIISAVSLIKPLDEEEFSVFDNLRFNYLPPIYEGMEPEREYKDSFLEYRIEVSDNIVMTLTVEKEDNTYNLPEYYENNPTVELRGRKAYYSCGDGFGVFKWIEDGYFFTLAGDGSFKTLSETVKNISYGDKKTEVLPSESTYEETVKVTKEDFFNENSEGIEILVTEDMSFIKLSGEDAEKFISSLPLSDFSFTFLDYGLGEDAFNSGDLLKIKGEGTLCIYKDVPVARLEMNDRKIIYFDLDKDTYLKFMEEIEKFEDLKEKIS